MRQTLYSALGTHPFVPAASRLGAPILCQRCPNDALHPVHDWLSTPAQDVLLPLTPEEMVQLENLPNGEPFEDINGIQRGAVTDRDDCDCVSRACSHGDCEDCPNNMANCCDCSCHYTRSQPRSWTDRSEDFMKGGR
jgi:hypothetical protein